MVSNYGNCNLSTVDEINGRLLARNLATGNVDVLIDSRPTPTKYTRPLQNIIPTGPCNSRIMQYNTNTANTFNPGDRKGGWSGFTANVNNESILRNQIYALQKFPQAQYAPNSTSDLYNSTIPANNTSTAQGLFPNLFNANLVPPKSNPNQNKSDASQEDKIGPLCESCWYRDNTECGAKKYKSKKKCRLWREDVELKDRLSWGDKREARQSWKGGCYYGQS